MNVPEDFNRLLHDSNGKLYVLSIVTESKSVSADQFVPEDLEFPNACRYIVHSIPDAEGLRDAVLFSDSQLKEQVVRKLKVLHGIQDPWDLEPDRFLKLWKTKKDATSNSESREANALLADALIEAKREAKLRSGNPDDEK